MKYGVVKRTEFFAALLKRANLPISAPSDFNGVPNAQPLKVWLFPYEKERSDDMVPSLWALFHQMRAGKIDGELFDKILKIPHTGFAKLTECLFYLSPEEYFPVDAQTKHWLKKKGVNYLKRTGNPTKSCCHGSIVHSQNHIMKYRMKLGMKIRVVRSPR